MITKQRCMAEYINKGNDGFKKARRSEYVDKSELIAFVNASLGTEQNMICVTRARRFGKSMAAKMLCAYYDQSCDSRFLFDDLKIASDASYPEHLNKYPVLYLDVTSFTSTCQNHMSDIVKVMESSLQGELQSIYPDVSWPAGTPLTSALLKVVESTGRKFIMIIDEWDAICREASAEPELMREYVNFLRSLFKSGNTDQIFEGVYMTGILPIIQYDTQSALNNFQEYTMISPAGVADYFGFTPSEVHSLAAKYKMDEDLLRLWYDGYQLGESTSIYNPYSVINATHRNCIESYWSATGAYEGLRRFITMNFNGLKDDVIRLVTGEKVHTDVMCFSNNIHDIGSRDAVLTVLIHLGYLSYDRASETVSIPNMEIRKEFEKTLKDSGWDRIAGAISDSEKLLSDTLSGEADKVAAAIDAIHSDSTSILQYNDENSLACVISLAYYAARKDYAIIRELPAGKGFADIVFMPRPGIDSPAILVELKYGKSSESALNQIKGKEYDGILKDFCGEVVLVGISYNRKSKIHECSIEKTSQKTSLKIVDLIENKPSIAAEEMSQILGISLRAVKYQLQNLKASGKIRRIGPDKGGRWEILSKE